MGWFIPLHPLGKKVVKLKGSERLVRSLNDYVARRQSGQSPSWRRIGGAFRRATLLCGPICATQMNSG